MNLGWPKRPIAPLGPVMPSSCFVQAYAPVGLLLGELGQLIFGDLVRSVMPVLGFSPCRGCPWIHVDS